MSGESYIVCPVVEYNELEKKQLHELVTPSSRIALRSLGLDVAILSGHEPLSWDEIASFNKNKLNNIAFISSFNQAMTKTESEMQELIQVVEDNKKHITASRKTPCWHMPPRWSLVSRLLQVYGLQASKLK